MEVPAVVGISLLEEFEGDEELGSGCFSGAHRVLVARRDELLIMGVHCASRHNRGISSLAGDHVYFSVDDESSKEQHQHLGI